MDFRLHWAALRRTLILVFVAALTIAPAASAAVTAAARAGFRPIRRDFGELTIPRVRTGKLTPTNAAPIGRTRVIVSLKLPPLAQAYGRTLFAAGSRQKLDVHSVTSRAYLAKIESAQAAAVARLKRTIPSARVSWRYQVILDAFTVSLPANKVSLLAKQSFVAKVWPSLTYHLNLNRSPGVIGADTFHTATGDNGQGIKIGIVDDGIDNTNPFLSGSGFTAPSGFPLGDTRFTNGKIIVARAYPGPDSGAGGKLALDRNASFHGTHVSGIAAGDANTCAPAGTDHPATCGLSGVAPKAFLGNYRVFNTKTILPGEYTADSPEIAAAFEQAVKDGMDVINFSGGGPQVDPSTDILIPAAHNVAAAGVTPVFSAGNDRDDFGFGTTGSPSTAPDAISVAAVSNAQVFAPALTAFDSSGKQVLHVPIQIGAAIPPPSAWETTNQLLVDVGSIIGKNGQPVDRQLCGGAADPNGGAGQLPAHSLDGAIALVSRGSCAFTSKADRAMLAGAIGIVIVDNRFGEANPIPVTLAIPGGMIADIDGAAVRQAMGSTGRILVHFGHTVEDIDTGRSGIITSFSAGGPTAFGHLLKPDVAAPGGQILSSTLPEFAGAPFAVFDGTSMSAPHVTGAVALLVQRHPSWTPQQIKSALMSTAGPAWGNTERTKEAPVTLEGAGLINVPRADDPQIFTDPMSISPGELNVTGGEVSKTIMVHISDAGDGSGSWVPTLQPQSATTGATVTLPDPISLAPGGSADVPVKIDASATATPGDDMGFIVLTKGTVTRRIPYYFEVSKPVLANVAVTALKQNQTGNTVKGVSHVSAYRFPTWPFGPPPNYSTGAGVNEPGAEHVYSFDLKKNAVNFGVTVTAQSANSIIDPWVLGAKDENDVLGYAGTPVNVNGLTYDSKVDSETAGVAYPKAGRYYVVVDSGSDIFTGKSLPGSYVLHYWVDDLEPPAVSLLTTTVGSGRPTIAALAKDAKSGVDPLSLVLNYPSTSGNILIGAAAYDAASGIALFPIPSGAPPITAGLKKKIALNASDNQETKNVNPPPGTNGTPNTITKALRINVVNRPQISWLLPTGTSCLRMTTRLVSVASSNKTLKTVTFKDGAKVIGSSKPDLGLAFKDWNVKKATNGKHTLSATVRDSAGRTATASRNVRVCK
jgi:subtilisin family serine protease